MQNEILYVKKDESTIPHPKVFAVDSDKNKSP